MLNRLEGHYIQGLGDGQNQPMTPLHLLDDAAKEAEAFIAHDSKTQERLERVAKLIEGFETPFGMELLSTVHWVAKHDREAGASQDAAVTGVHAWNERKATTMKAAQIRPTWDRLKELGWF